MVTTAEPGPTATPPTRTAHGTSPLGAREPRVGANPELPHWRWGDTARAWTAGVAATLFAMVAAGYAVSWYGADAAGWWLLAVAAVAGAVGTLLGRLTGLGSGLGSGPGSGLVDGTRAAGGGVGGDPLAVQRRQLSVVLLAVAGLLGTYGAWAAASGTPEAQLAGMAGTVAVTLALAGISTAAGRSALFGAGAVVVTAGLWEIGLWLGNARGAGIVLGALAVVALGFVPRLALLGSGLTRLDDQRSRDTSVSHLQVDAALAVNHRLYAPATVTVVLSAVAGGWLALSELTPWTVALALLFAVLLCSRARAYPLTIEVVVLTVAAAVLLVRLSVLWAAESAAAGPLALLGVAAVAPLVTLAVRPPESVRERLRQLMNLVESLSVVLLVPVAVGAFGAYGALLNLL